jgi:hypothetical protein
MSDDYTYKGMRTLVMENEKLRVSLLLDKGADIFEFLYKPLDIDFMQRTRNGVINPASHFPTIASKGGNYWEFWYGGWQEVFPTAGAPVEYKGAEEGLHGEVFLLPWHHQVLQDDVDCISVHLWVRTVRLPFLLERIVTLRRGEPILTFEEQATNEGHIPLHYMWGHHPCISVPFLDEQCVVDAPAETVVTPDEAHEGYVLRTQPGRWNWPHVPLLEGGTIDLSRVLPPEARVGDAAFLTDFREGWCAITNQSLKLGFALTWPASVFRWMWFWMVYGGALAAPFFGRTYNIALEPFTSYPMGLEGSIAAGTAPMLEPGASVSATLRAIVYTGLSRVSSIDADGVVSGN